LQPRLVVHWKIFTLNHESLWHFFFASNLIAASAAVHWLPAKFSWVIATAISGGRIFCAGRSLKPVLAVATLKGLRWKRNQFCRGWLITGDTGSGKTSSGINQLAHQVFRNEPGWGGLCIDEKASIGKRSRPWPRHYGRLSDLIHVQIRPEDASANWTPTHRFNLTGNRTIPFSSYAKFVRGHRHESWTGGDKGFFKSQAQTAHCSRIGIAFRASSSGDAHGRV